MVLIDFIGFKKNSFLYVSLFLICNLLNAQDLEPRSYANMPKGGNVIVASYGYMKGDIVSEPTLPIKDFLISSNNFGVGYLHTFGLAGKI
jgi:hypothetical protein